VAVLLYSASAAASINLTVTSAMTLPTLRTLSTVALLIVVSVAGCDYNSLENPCQAPAIVEDDQISAQGPPPPPPTRDEASVRSHINSCSGGSCEIEVLEVLFTGTDVPEIGGPGVMTTSVPTNQSYQHSSPPDTFRLILRHEDKWRIDEIRSVDCSQEEGN
jgi:hypothetical protein